eukprot:13478393-Alexandrium_andersonii.AAC.1
MRAFCAIVVAPLWARSGGTAWAAGGCRRYFRFWAGPAPGACKGYADSVRNTGVRSRPTVKRN